MASSCPPLAPSLALAACMAGPCLAAGAPALPDALLACGRIQDTTARAHCYDAQIAALEQRQPAPAAHGAPPAGAAAATGTPATVPAGTARRPAAPATAPAAPTVQTVTAAEAPPAYQAMTGSAAASFGAELLPAPSRPTSTQREQVLLSSISSVRSVGPLIWLIVLANGQIWRQEGSQTPYFFRSGDDIRIDRGALGSYHLSAPRIGVKNWVQVIRVR